MRKFDYSFLVLVSRFEAGRGYTYTEEFDSGDCSGVPDDFGAKQWLEGLDDSSDFYPDNSGYYKIDFALYPQGDYDAEPIFIDSICPGR